MRLDLTDIEEKIHEVHYHHWPETGHTSCLIILKNGFTVDGFSACVDLKKYNRIMGENIAYERAVQKVWDLEAYLLKERMYQMTQPDVSPTIPPTHHVQQD